MFYMNKVKFEYILFGGLHTFYIFLLCYITYWYLYVYRFLGSFVVKPQAKRGYDYHNHGNKATQYLALDLSRVNQTMYMYPDSQTLAGWYDCDDCR